jgi:hypothetical protein
MDGRDCTSILIEKSDRLHLWVIKYLILIYFYFSLWANYAPNLGLLLFCSWWANYGSITCSCLLPYQCHLRLLRMLMYCIQSLSFLGLPNYIDPLISFVPDKPAVICFVYLAFLSLEVLILWFHDLFMGSICLDSILTWPRHLMEPTF